MIISILGKLKFKNEILKSCRYSVGGGMNGGYTIIYLARDKQGRQYLETRHKNYHYSREITTVYPVAADAFEQVKKRCFEYDMYAASKARMSPFEVLDGDTTTLSFDFEKDGFRVSDNQMLTAKHKEGIKTIRNYLINCKEGEGVKTVEPQEMIMRVDGYSLIYHMTPAFDSKLDNVLSEKISAVKYADKGIILATVKEPDTADALPLNDAAAGNIICEINTGRIIALYQDCHFDGPVYLVADMVSHSTSAYELLQNMEGEYYVNLN